ncbi:MAG TPA: hypothetical protein DDW95_08630 [Alphaproteobacteria bacterium]|nr:hypothetical protein [Alphaproteobacteria bacterium]HBF98600.1 hypothetical protein [Alphaproteobacteria bacterium]
MLTRDIQAQLDALPLQSDQPLIVTDADEVIAQFIVGLEDFLTRNGFWLDLQSFAISGNVKRAEDHSVVERAEVQELLAQFFAADTESLLPVPGAADALSALSKRTQIIVLSNVPQPQRAARQRWLRQHGMDYPLVANSGPKGAAVRHLRSNIKAPIFFLDDLPPNLASVSELVEDVHLLHFIADSRLAALMGPAPDCHLHTTSWDDAHAYIAQALDLAGFTGPQ